MKMRYLHIAILFPIVMVLTACERFLDIKPVGSVIPENEEQYRALLTNAYSRFPTDRGLAMFRSDEVQLNAADSYSEASYLDIYTWNDNAPSDYTASFQWKDYYHIIYLANHIIAELADADGLTPAMEQMVGEAYCLRAYAHFTLVCLFAPPYADSTLNAPAVPLSMNTDTETTLSRSTVAQVYASVEADIASAMQYLNAPRWTGTLAYRWSVQAAWAFRSRLYLYMARWNEAIGAAQQALALGGTLLDLNRSRAVAPAHHTSPECIQALDFVITADYLKAARPSGDIMALFDPTGDLRFLNLTVRETAAGDYAIAADGSPAYRTTFRVGELYLNMAEAHVRLGNTTAARDTLLALKRNRLETSYFAADSAAVVALDSDALLQAVLNERARELAFQGHRWFDLRRTSQQQLIHRYNGAIHRLNRADARYTIPIPKEAREGNANL